MKNRVNEDEFMKDGSIVIFLFYDFSSGKQAKLAFSDEFRHCNVVVFDGKSWIVSEFTMEGIINRVVKVTSASRFIESLKKIETLQALVSVQIEQRTHINWRPFWVRSCNEVCRYVSGIDVGFTWNPRHLYNKLLKCKEGNHEVLAHWRRKEHGAI